MKVLIIDDEPLVLQTFGYAFSLGGWTAVTHDQNADCAKLILEHEIDILLIDYQMPGMNGLEMVEQLRHAGIQIPTVMMSANAHVIDRSRAKRLGIFKIVWKPSTIKQLRGVLMDAVLKSRETAKASLTNPKPNVEF